MADGSSHSPTDPRAGFIQVRLDEVTRVAVVSFERGSANYLTYEFLEQLVEALERLQPPGCRAIVLRTASRHFSAGADFTGERPSRPGGPHIFDLVPRLYCLPVPVIAAVRGAAIGAGLGLALSADFRIATPATYFLANFNRIGLSPGFGLTLTLPHLVGTQRAAEMFYMARRIGGQDALSFGLCDRLVDGERLEEEALTLAKTIALAAPQAVARTRRALRARVVDNLQTVLDLERAEQATLIDTDDVKEGVRAWREKRVPNFSS